MFRYTAEELYGSCFKSRSVSILLWYNDKKQKVDTLSITFFMKKYVTFFVALMLVSSFALPAFAQTDTVTLTAQIQSLQQELIKQLMARIEELKAQLSELQAAQAGVPADASSSGQASSTAATDTQKPVITSVEAKASDVGVLYGGERAFIHGSGLSGALTIKLGVQEPRYVKTTGMSDVYAEFVVPEYVPERVYVSLTVTNASGVSSSPYEVQVRNNQ